MIESEGFNPALFYESKFHFPIAFIPEFLKTGLGFYFLAIKSNKIRPKADKKAYIWRQAVS